MALLDILMYPNPLLRQKARLLSAEEIASETVQTLVGDMVETLYHHPGTVGLAAPQVGVVVRIFVMDATAKTTREGLKVLINPVIHQQAQWKYSREGCLSFPDYLVTVKRARKITLSWQTPEGALESAEMRDMEAIIAQHETDHLDGILFIDRVRNFQTDLMLRNPGNLPHHALQETDIRLPVKESVPPLAGP